MHSTTQKHLNAIDLWTIMRTKGSNKCKDITLLTVVSCPARFTSPITGTVYVVTTIAVNVTFLSTVLSIASILTILKKHTPACIQLFMKEFWQLVCDVIVLLKVVYIRRMFLCVWFSDDDNSLRD